MANANHLRCNTSGNFYAGFGVFDTSDSYGKTYRGTSAYVTARPNASICDYPLIGQSGMSNWAVTWVMIASGDDATLNHGYAQVGYMQRYGGGGGTYYYTEYRQGPGSSGFTRRNIQDEGWGPVGDGQNHHLFVQYSPSKQKIEMNVDATNFANTSFDPFYLGYPNDLRWYFPFDPKWSGETAWLETDMPGLVSRPSHFSDMRMLDSTYVFQANFPPPPYLRRIQSNPRYYVDTNPTNRAFNVYTAF